MTPLKQVRFAFGNWVSHCVYFSEKPPIQIATSLLRWAEQRDVGSSFWIKQKNCAEMCQLTRICELFVREARSYGYSGSQRDDKWHAFRGAKQPVRQLSNKSDRQSVDVSMCSYSSSFTQCMCMKYVFLDNSWVCFLCACGRDWLKKKSEHVMVFCIFLTCCWLSGGVHPSWMTGLRPF